MTHEKKLIPGYLLLWLLLSHCVSPLDLPEGEVRPAVILSGLISNSQAQRSFQLYRNVGLSGERQPISGATGEVFRDGAAWAELIEVEPGRYLLPRGFPIEAGRTYHVALTLDDGTSYQSTPVQVPERLRTDSLSFAKERRVVGVSRTTGGPLRREVVEVYAHVTLPDPEEAVFYYRWQVDQVWAFTEIAKPASERAPGEPDRVQTCYLRREESENPSTLLSSEGLGQAAIRVPVFSQIINQEFAERHYINVYLHAITEEAHEFYEQLERLEAIDGSLYDEIPAAVRGNVANAADSSDFVLGFVEFSLADTARLWLDPGRLGEPIRRPCLPVGGVSPCNPPPSRSPNDTTPYFCRCWDCDQIYGFQTLVRPGFWE